ncbi:sensor histidine kinase [Bdellovibrionota bacterium]
MSLKSKIKRTFSLPRNMVRASRIIRWFVPAKIRNKSSIHARRGYSLVVCAVSVGGMGLYYFLTKGAITHDSRFILAAVLFLFISPLFLRITKSQAVSSWIVITFGLIFLLTYTFLNGGLGSSTVQWYFIIPVAATLIASEFAALVTALVLIAALACFFYVQTNVVYLYSTSTASAFPLMVVFLVTSVQIFFAGVVAWYFESMRIKTEKKLHRAKEIAIKATASKSQFLSMISHEIRNPLTVVLGMNEILVDTKLDEEQMELVKGMQRGGDHMVTIISDFLDYEKLESKKIRFHYEPFNIETCVKDVIEFYKEKASEKGLMLKMVFDDEIPKEIVGDEIRVKQILMNLVGNALKFTDKGNITTHISSSTQNGNYNIKFEVIDTGIGIPKDECELLFQPFEQADSGAAKRHKGTGLGLSISKLLAEGMGGDISVESVEGRGSTFRFSIKTKA